MKRPARIPHSKTYGGWLNFKEVGIGAWLTGLMGFFGGMAAAFGNDDAFKYIDVHLVYWLRIIGAVGFATCLPLRGYFSTAYKGSGKDRQKKG